MTIKRIRLLLAAAGLFLLFPGCQKQQQTVQTPTEQTESTHYTVGAAVQLNSWEITLNSQQVGQEVQDEHFVTAAEADKTYLALEYRVKNNGAQPAVFAGPGSELRVYAYTTPDQTVERSVTMLSTDLTNQTIQPGQEATGLLLFHVPSGKSGWTARMVQGEEMREWTVN